MHVNHSHINSSETCGFESDDRTKGFNPSQHVKTGQKTNNHHLRQSFFWQLSLCGNYTIILTLKTRHKLAPTSNKRPS